MNPQAVLHERYPLADFSIYFRHLEACRTEKGLNTQDHHICPRKQFPEYAEGFPENLITLMTDDHNWAHKLLEAACGIYAPPTVLFEGQRDAAAKGGRTSKGGRIGGRTGGKKGGPIAARICKEKGIGWFAPGVAAAAGVKARHIYWHVKRGIVNPECSLCQ